MLSMTDMDAPKFSFATPEDVKEASQKAMNFWVGALSPMWVPFWAASSFGVGAWALTQGLSKSLAGGMKVPAYDLDLPLATKWPGFALPFATPWSKDYGIVAEELDTAIELGKEIVRAPVQITLAAEQKLETAAVQAAETVKETVIKEAPVVAPVMEAPAKIAETVAETPKPAVKAPAAVKATKAATALRISKDAEPAVMAKPDDAIPVIKASAPRSPKKQ